MKLKVDVPWYNKHFEITKGFYGIECYQCRKTANFLLEEDDNLYNCPSCGAYTMINRNESVANKKHIAPIYGKTKIHEKPNWGLTKPEIDAIMDKVQNKFTFKERK